MADNNFEYDPEIHGKLVPDYDDDTVALKRGLVKELRKLWQEKNYGKVITYVEGVLDKLPEKPIGGGDKDFSEIYLIYGSSIWEETKDKVKAKPFAEKSAAFDRMNKGAMWLLRELRNEYSENSKYFLMEEMGEHYAPTKEGVQLFPFKTMYSVVAETPEEAWEMIIEYEREEISGKLELLNVKEAKKEGDLPKGVYSNTNLIVMQRQEEKPGE